MAARGYKAPSPTVVQQSPTAELAYREIDIADQADREWLTALVGISRHSSADAWKNYRRIGEVRYALARSQRIAGYAKLSASKFDPGGKKVSKAERGVVAEIVDSITSRFGGTRGLIEKFYLLRMVPGEAYLIRLRDKPGAEPDGYWFLSPSELSTPTTDTASALTDPLRWTTARKRTSASTSAFDRTILQEDFYGRVWAPDGEYTDECDSPMQGINGLCDQLWDLTVSVQERLRSRLAMNGLLLIPMEMNDAAVSASVPVGTYSSNKVLNYFIHVMTHNLVHSGDAKAKMPIAAMGPAEVLDKLKWVIEDFQIQETDLKLRAELIGRILDGLYQSKPQAQGNEGASHFQAWTNGDEERRIAVAPDLDSLCHALTRMVLRKELLERNWEPGKIMPWRLTWDLSDAQVKSNQGEDTRQGWDRGWVNAEFARKQMGATDLDKMDDAEYARWVGVKTGNPYLACYGLEGIKADWDIVAGFGSKTGPDPKSQGEPEKAGPGTGNPGSPDDDDSDTPKTERPG